MGMETSALTLPRGAMLRFVDDTAGETSDGLFIGPEDNSELVVVPLAETQRRKKAGETLKIRYGSRDAMVEFRSELLEVIDYPVLLWRIRVPEKVNRFDMRDHKRIHCSVAASIEAVDKGLLITGIIRDIGKRGARCALQTTGGGQSPLTIDDDITLRCTFPGIPGEQAAAGKITEVVQTEDELAVGIQFAETLWWVPPYH